MMKTQDFHETTASSTLDNSPGDGSDMEDIPLLRFIPFRRADIVSMCLDHGLPDPSALNDFELAQKKIEQHFQQEFAAIRQRLKDAYAPLDPDADTRMVNEFRAPQAEDALAAELEAVLNRANYEKISKKTLKRAFRSASLFKVRLYVEMNDFKEVLLFARGVSRREEDAPVCFGLWRKRVSFINFDRVALYIRFHDNVDTDTTLGGCQPGSTMLKLFQNVPAADLEMLFPNTRVGMRLTDKLLIGIPALVSGGIVWTTKLGATLVLLGTLLGFWLGVHNEPVKLDKAAVLVLMAGAAALAGYLWKQFSSFRNRKLRYTQALTQNLYFKLLDNNAGVIFRILDEAEESECKEAILAYYFLLASGKQMTAGELDQAIESWLEEKWHCRLDFEIDDALAKLEKLKLASREGEFWRVEQ